MALGPGIYDELCTYVRNQAKAEGVLLIVLGGEHGNGFSCQADMETTMQLPALLESVARQIRQSGPFIPDSPSWPKPICPKCGGAQFRAGPRGGLSTNIMCINCQNWFNYTPVLPDLEPIPRPPGP